MIDAEVNITKDGFNIQTSMSTFKNYYKHLGWQFVGLAPTLKGFGPRPGIKTELPSPELVQELHTNQARLF